MAISTILSDARASVWDAILNWEELDGVFKRKYRHDEDGGDDSPEVNPHPSQLPAIRIVSDSSPVAAVLNRMSEVQYKLNIWIYTANWYLPTPEGYLMEILASLFRANGAGQDYVKDETGFHPISDYQIYPPSFINLGKNKVTLCGLSVSLRVRFDPFSI